MEKKEISVHLLCPIGIWDLEGDINEVANKIRNIPIRLKESPFGPINYDVFHRYTFAIEQNYDDDKELSLYGIRWETDEEYKERIEREERMKELYKKQKESTQARKEKRERTLLKNLITKYGK